jgi:hypothetical protein
MASITYVFLADVIEDQFHTEALHIRDVLQG